MTITADGTDDVIMTGTVSRRPFTVFHEYVTENGARRLIYSEWVENGSGVKETLGQRIEALQAEVARLTAALAAEESRSGRMAEEMEEGRVTNDPLAWMHPNGAIWRVDNCPDIDFIADGWIPLYAVESDLKGSTDAQS